MKEHKFTDDEIIKALECCIGSRGVEACSGCPLNFVYGCENSYYLLEKLSLDLINRQKAEIERLREIRDLCNTTILEKNEQIEKLKISDASKEECTIRQHGEIKELKAEIERLQDYPKCAYQFDGEVMDYCLKFPCRNFKTAEEIKAEARKECAKEICEEIIKRFDRLLKAEPNRGTTTSAKDFLEAHLPYVINSILKGITEDAGK